MARWPGVLSSMQWRVEESSWRVPQLHMDRPGPKERTIITLPSADFWENDIGRAYRGATRAGIGKNKKK